MEDQRVGGRWGVWEECTGGQGAPGIRVWRVDGRLEGEEGRGDNIVAVGTFFIGAVWLEVAGSHMAESTRILIFTK